MNYPRMLVGGKGMRNAIHVLMIMFVGSGCAVYHPHVTSPATKVPARKIDPQFAQVLVPNDYALFRELRNRGVNAYCTRDTPDLRLLMDESERIVTADYQHMNGAPVGVLANLLVSGVSLLLIPTWSTWPARGNYVVKKLDGEVEADKTFHMKSKLWFWLPLFPFCFSRERSYDPGHMQPVQRERLAAAAADALAPILARKDDRSGLGREAWHREPLTTRVEVFNVEKLIQGFTRLRSGMTLSEVGENVGSSLAALIMPGGYTELDVLPFKTGNPGNILRQFVMDGRDNIFLFTLDSRTSMSLLTNAGVPVIAIHRRAVNFRTRGTPTFRFESGPVGPDMVSMFLRDNATVVAGLRFRFDNNGTMVSVAWLEHPDKMLEQY